MHSTSRLAAVVSLAAVALLTSNAEARTSTWTGALAENVNQNVCLFSNSAGGGLQFNTAAAASCAGGGFIDASVTWDTAGNKTVTISGFQTALGQISSCGVRTMDANGALVAFTSFPAFTVINAYQSVTTPSFVLPIGGTSQVECRISNSAARLLKIDNNAP